MLWFLLYIMEQILKNIRGKEHFIILRHVPFVLLFPHSQCSRYSSGVSSRLSEVFLYQFFRACLLAINFFLFFFIYKSILLSIMKNIFTGNRIVGWQFFSFSTSKMLFYSLQTWWFLMKKYVITGITTIEIVL